MVDWLGGMLCVCEERGWGWGEVGYIYMGY